VSTTQTFSSLPIDGGGGGEARLTAVFVFAVDDRRVGSDELLDAGYVAVGGCDPDVLRRRHLNSEMLLEVDGDWWLCFVRNAWWGGVWTSR